jgi:hypothetical protein
MEVGSMPPILAEFLRDFSGYFGFLAGFLGLLAEFSGIFDWPGGKTMNVTKTHPPEPARDLVGHLLILTLRLNRSDDRSTRRCSASPRADEGTHAQQQDDAERKEIQEQETIGSHLQTPVPTWLRRQPNASQLW